MKGEAFTSISCTLGPKDPPRDGVWLKPGPHPLSQGRKTQREILPVLLFACPCNPVSLLYISGITLNSPTANHAVGDITHILLRVQGASSLLHYTPSPTQNLSIATVQPPGYPAVRRS